MEPLSRITLVIGHLEMGGAQRVLTQMANYWIRQDINVQLINLREPADPFYQLDDEVRLIHLHLIEYGNNHYTINSRFRKARELRKHIEEHRSQVVLSFGYPVNIFTSTSLCFRSCPCIVSERTNLQAFDISILHRLLRWLTLPLADRLVVQTDRARAKLPFTVRHKAHVIPNPICPEIFQRRLAPQNSTPYISSVGRLSSEKNFSMLIQAFDRTVDQFPEWRLHIAGEGPLREQLLHEISACRVPSRIQLCGTQSDIAAFLKSSSVFVLSSDFEGFPNALLEAMALGLPVISTDCPTGPRELITHEENGLLVPPNDVHAMEKALRLLMSDKDLRKRLGEHATYVTEKYNEDVIMQKWMQVINESRA